ncbi:BQ5605_C034g11322 [Microbotryum silenes-dioicae]|uniref:BQ5605_C034g11322 protein n=1 Tax=Microbotryum silenes-dioicae TaxID=796604 RepID=A0A2X0PB49_9BASI|nr:BQ5605_C034g11322 [Microbotryum silenes-dioicae]
MSSSSPEDQDDSLRVHPATQAIASGATLIDPTPSDEAEPELHAGASATAPSTLTEQVVVDDEDNEENEDTEDDEDNEEEDEDVTPSQKLWPVKAIIGERRGQYLLAWDGTDEHGRSYEPTWEAKSNATLGLIKHWEATKAPQATNKHARATCPSMNKKGKQRMSSEPVIEIEQRQRTREKSSSVEARATGRPVKKGRKVAFQIRPDSDSSESNESDNDDTRGAGSSDGCDRDVVIIEETMPVIVDSQGDEIFLPSSLLPPPYLPDRKPLAELSVSSSSTQSIRASSSSSSNNHSLRSSISVVGSTPTASAVSARPMRPVPIPTATDFYPLSQVEIDPIENPDSSPVRPSMSRLPATRPSTSVPLRRTGSKPQLELVLQTPASSGSSSSSNRTCSDENSSLSLPMMPNVLAHAVVGPFSVQVAAQAIIAPNKINMMRPPPTFLSEDGDGDMGFLNARVAVRRTLECLHPLASPAHPFTSSFSTRSSFGNYAAADGSEGEPSAPQPYQQPVQNTAPIHGLSAPESYVASTNDSNGSIGSSIIPSSTNGASSLRNASSSVPAGSAAPPPPPAPNTTPAPTPNPTKRDFPESNEEEQQSKKAKMVEFADNPLTSIETPPSTTTESERNHVESTGGSLARIMDASTRITLPPHMTPFTVPTQPLSPALARVQAVEGLAAESNDRQGSPGPSGTGQTAAVSRNASPAPGGGSHVDGLIQLVHASTYITDTDSTKAEIERFLRDPKAYASNPEGPLCRVAHWAFELRHVTQENIEKIDFIIVHSQVGTYQLKRVAAAHAQFDFARSLAHASTRTRGLTPGTPAAVPAPSAAVEPAAPLPKPIEMMSRDELERELGELRAQTSTMSAELETLPPLALEVTKLRTEIATLLKQNCSLAASKESAQSDFAYMQAQYSQASTAAVMRARETVVAEAETLRLRSVLDRGLKQNAMLFKAENKKLKFMVKRLEGEMALLKAERRRVAESEVIKKAALWDDFQAELKHHEEIENDLERNDSSDEEDERDDDEESAPPQEESAHVAPADTTTSEEVNLSSSIGETVPLPPLVCQWKSSGEDGRVCDATLQTREELEQHMATHQTTQSYAS